MEVINRPANAEDAASFQRKRRRALRDHWLLGFSMRLLAFMFVWGLLFMALGGIVNWLPGEHALWNSSPRLLRVGILILPAFSALYQTTRGHRELRAQFDAEASRLQSLEEITLNPTRGILVSPDDVASMLGHAFAMLEDGSGEVLIIRCIDIGVLSAFSSGKSLPPELRVVTTCRPRKLLDIHGDGKNPSFVWLDQKRTTSRWDASSREPEPSHTDDFPDVMIIPGTLDDWQGVLGEFLNNPEKYLAEGR